MGKGGKKRMEKEGKKVSILNDFTRRFLPDPSPDILNIEELASLYHLPNTSVETPNIEWSGAKKAEPPLDLPVNRGTIFAESPTNMKKSAIFLIRTSDSATCGPH
jgi:hypothetical protein